MKLLADLLTATVSAMKPITQYITQIVRQYFAMNQPGLTGNLCSYMRGNIPINIPNKTIWKKSTHNQNIQTIN